MRFSRFSRLTWISLALVLLIVSYFIVFSGHQIDYNTEVKPILNKKCITCHGGVKQQAGFSLLFRQEALAPTKSGKPAIIPGDPDHSEMIRRLSLSDPEERMPYRHEPLSSTEIKTLRNWIKQGAVWGDHWAYTPVRQQTVPKVDNWLFGIRGGGNWVKNEIDHFTYAKMYEQGLKPAAEADKSTLLRRVSLDLTGLPPTASLAQWFLQEKSDKAFEILVDSLLASPRYGERWTAMWMDLARYADTKGYERDDSRSIWRYRDWLIRAFNDNKPYDQFLIEQVAGDLLPDPTDAQYIATAFHRNTMTNDEGGTDNEEFRTAAVIDRVNTTWETLMGTTFACVQCHSHPYDPFKHEEYYRFMAFFNNTRDEDTYDDYPILMEFHDKDSVRYAAMKNWLQQYAPERVRELTGYVKTGEPAINSIASDELINAALTDTKWLVLRNNATGRIPGVDFQNRTQFMYRYRTKKTGGVWVLHLDKPDGPIIASIPVKDTKGPWNIATVNIPAVAGAHDIYYSYRNPQLKDAEETGMMFDWFRVMDPFPGKGVPGYDSAFSYFNQLFSPKQVTRTPVMVENTGAQIRATHVFERGNWMVKGKVVSADVPESFGRLPKHLPHNRLGLAKWLVDEKNPLVSRTIVNRIWEQFFGQGIAETLEDLGTQGLPPTHREMLDQLAWQLIHEDHWNLKALMKRIVLSATYRQDSKFDKTATEKDLFNKYYARGPRVRLSAEQMRDQALQISGVLCEKMYGPGVFPYQPDGIWMTPYNGAVWKKSDSSDQYRRALYTYWKRSSPYPSMINFDGTSRENCTARRIRTNTPLQSLTSLNDSAYLDMAQHFAARMKKMAGTDIKQQIRKGYELALFRSISPERLAVFERLYAKALQQFAADPYKTVCMAGDPFTDKKPDDAALVVVASALLNQDELITKN
jgi:hypothetical protein